MTHDVGPRWEIVRDQSAPRPPYVLAQVSRDGTAGRFPLAIWDATTLRDGEVSVAFKTVDGKVDQAAGIVWRYRDPNNYYIVRANALESMLFCIRSRTAYVYQLHPKGYPPGPTESNTKSQRADGTH
jgi:hypothetical protein